MVINGAARGRPAELALHLLKTEHNERVHILDIWGTGAPDLTTALYEMNAIGAGARSRRTLYHANIDPRKDEQLNEAQKRTAVEKLGKRLGLDGQPFVVVEHVKKGRGHLHVVWSRISLETMTAIPDSHNFRAHEEVARDLEREFGHERTHGVHVGREGEERPRRAPAFAEYQQAERSGLTPQQAKQIVTECWHRTTTGQEFVHNLEAQGFTLARGDRRDFILVDRAGEIHGLTRRVDQVKAAEIRERLVGLDADALPDVVEVRRRLQEMQAARQPETGKGFVSSLERLNTEERKAAAQSRAGLRHTDQEIADAIWQLGKTMRSQIEATIPGKPESPQQELRPSPGSRSEIAVERTVYPGSSLTEPLAVKADEPVPAQPPVPTRTGPKAAAQPSLWQRVSGWVHGRSQPHHEPSKSHSGSSDLPNIKPEAIQRRSVETEKAEHRPSASLFIRIFGVLVEAYQNALDPAIEQKRQAGFQQNHTSRPEPPPKSQPLRSKHPGLADEATRKWSQRPASEKLSALAADAAQRLREQEERERSLTGEDPRY